MTITSKYHAPGSAAGSAAGGAAGGADRLELKLRLAQDSAVQLGARLDLAVKREHLVLLKD